MIDEITRSNVHFFRSMEKVRINGIVLSINEQAGSYKISNLVIDIASYILQNKLITRGFTRRILSGSAEKVMAKGHSN